MMDMSLGKEAIDVLTALASARSSRDSESALLRARQVLGDLAKEFEPLLATLASRSDELSHLQRLVTLDPLTGVANRRGFEQALGREISRQQRTNEPFAVVMLDLDDLKRRNDSLGHAVGDAAIVATARACEEVVRSTDLVARLGGDEFAVLLPGTTMEGAQILAQRLRDSIEAMLVSGDPLRVSLGVAASAHGPVLMHTLMAVADHELYRDKADRKLRAGLHAA